MRSAQNLRTDHVRRREGARPQLGFRQPAREPSPFLRFALLDPSSSPAAADTLLERLPSSPAPSASHSAPTMAFADVLPGILAHHTGTI